MAIKFGGADFSEEQFQVMIDKGLIGVEKHDPASTTPTATPLHGKLHGNSSQYGIFARPGAREEVLNLTARPRTLLNRLNFRPADNYNELQDVITGVTAGSGNNATDFCGNPPVAGQFKSTRLTFEFGEYYIKTKLNVIPKIGLRKDRADVPRRIQNNPNWDSRVMPDLASTLAPSDTMDQLANEFYTTGIDAERTWSRVVYTGNTATASASTLRGFIKEPNGLDQYIKTGYTAPRLDSMVTTYNAAVTGTDSVGRSIVQALADTFFGLKERAEGFGIYTTWALTMRPDMFRALTEVVAWQYYTRGMTGAAGTPILQYGTEITNFRDRMLNERFLLIEGEQVEVILDTGIPRENTANATYKSDMYFVPVESSVGDLTYVEFADMNNPYINEFTNAVMGAGQIGNINNGLYLVANRSTGFCWEYLLASQWRIILRAPALAGRLDDVIYTFRSDAVDATPGESFYFNGGDTYWNGIL